MKIVMYLYVVQYNLHQSWGLRQLKGLAPLRVESPISPGDVNGGVLAGATTINTDGGSRIYNVPLFLGIFNIDKYFPLLLTDQGIDLYFYVNPAVDIGAWTPTATEVVYTGSP